MQNLKLFLQWLSRQSLARIFAYTRRLEADLVYWKDAHKELSEAAYLRERELQNMREEDRLAWERERKELLNEVLIRHGAHAIGDGKPIPQQERGMATVDRSLPPRKQNIFKHMRKDLEKVGLIKENKGA